MAEPASPGQPAAGTAERDVLLATKLHIPRPRRGFVPRSRLADRLTDTLALELTLVCAPAGFGKTSLLGDWARHRQSPVAWLSLDAGDNDPVRFWRYVAAALDQVCGGVGEPVGALLRDPQPPPEAVVTVVLNAVAAQSDEIALVLDDVHLVEAEPVHHSLGLLLDRLPSQLRLLLASRRDPPLPLARLRARGQLVELRAADLRFTTEETAALLREAIGLELPAASLAALSARTEGWVAGLQLAALSLQGQADPARLVERFSGSHRYVLDYLTEEVLARQPEPLREFLLETSVLDRVSGPLCDAVTGRDDSQALLEQIERANLFLIPLDEVRGWWRYHHLFADLLRARLQQADRDRTTRLHRAAAIWCERHGLVDEAMRHALAAGDAGWAARLVEQHFEELLRDNQDATLRRWLERLPAEAVHARPRLCMAQAFIALIGGRLEEVESLLAAAERALAAGSDEPHQPSVGQNASVVANISAAIASARAAVAHFRGDAEQTITFARQALAGLDKGEWMQESVTRWYLLLADWMRGEPAEAERSFASMTSSIASWRAAGLRTMAVWGYHQIGQVQRAQGHLGAALGTYQEALEVATPDGQALLAAGVAYVGMAEVAYQRGELDAALDYVTRGVALCRQLDWTLPLMAGLATLAWIRQERGDRAGAVEAIGEGERVGVSPTVVGLLNPLQPVRARLLLAQGDIAAAAGWTAQCGLDAGDEPSYPREREYLVLARVLLASGQADRALGLLERWTALAVTQRRTGSVIELLVLQALAHAARGDEPAALAALTGAVALGAPEGYLRVFVDEGPPMAALFRRLLAGRRLEQLTADGAVPREYLTRLVAAFERAGAPIVPPARRGAVVVAGLVEPLSARELEVLGLLAAGRSNRQVAEELVVTLDTVKSHVAHILAKLGAANRTEAVARARELGLLG